MKAPITTQQELNRMSVTCLTGAFQADDVVEFGLRNLMEAAKVPCGNTGRIGNRRNR